MNNIKRVQKDIYFDNFLSQHMNRVPLALFLIEDDRNNDINTGTIWKCHQYFFILLILLSEIFIIFTLFPISPNR